MEQAILIKYGILLIFAASACYAIFWLLGESYDVLRESLLESASRVKSQNAKLEFYAKIEKTKRMKKYVGISILLVVVVILGLSSLVIFDSRDYFKQYFKNQRDKIELASQASIDSLKTAIVARDKKIDSLLVIVNANVAKTDFQSETLQQLKAENKNLVNVIKHQNQMINEFRKVSK